MRKSLLSTVIPLLGVSASNEILAEQSVQRIPSVIVSAARSHYTEVSTASAVSVISREEIKASGATTVADLLRGKAGIHVSDLFGDGSNASIDMRGFGNTSGSNVLVMVDGRKLNHASDIGTLYLNSVNLDNVEQIEIIQGSSGILFGNQAVGGVINIITRKADAYRAEASAGVGSFNRKDASLRIENRSQSGWGFRGDLHYRDSENYRDQNDSELKTLSLLLDHESAAGRYFLEHEIFDQDVETPGALFLDELAADRKQSVSAYTGDYIETKSNITRVGAAVSLNENWMFEGEASYRDDDREFVQSFRFSSGSLSTQDRMVWDVNPRLIGSIGDTEITAGIDFQFTDYLLVSSFGPQGVEQKVMAYYAQAVRPLSDDFTVIAGIRRASVDNDINNNGTPVDLDDDVTIGSLAIAYQPDNQWKWTARADQNYRFAKVDEHTNPVFGQPVGLENQQGITYETGLEFESSTYKTSVLLYRLELDDEISFDASGFSNVNLDETRRNGLVWSAETWLNPDILLGFNYDYIDSEITAGSNKGNDIPLVPEHKLRVFSQLSLTPQASLNLEGIYVSDQVYGADFSNSFQKMDSYTVFNLSGLYQRDNWSIGLRINNLFNKKYSETGNIGLDSGFTSRPAENPAPERSLWLQARIDLAQ